MKKIILISGLLLGLMLLSGCLSTLHPIFTEKDLVFDPRLAGSWKKAKDGSTVRYRMASQNDVAGLSSSLQRNANKIFILEESDTGGNSKGSSLAFLVRIGKYYYMDYYPVEPKHNGIADEFFAAHYIPMHSIYRVKFTNEQKFERQQLDAGYLEKLIRNKQVRLEHEETDDGSFLITAPTAELQQYLIKYSDVPEAYNNDNKDEFTKIK